MIAPSPEVLKIPFIQVKDPKTGLVSCPRGEFYRMMFTEEIKYAIKHGYKFEILYGYQFKKGKLFTDFVNIHYENKKNAPDPIKKHICKLLSNSLYGKFGMKDIESILKVVPVAKANFIQKNYNYSIFAHLTDDKVLIRYSSRINETLRNFFKKQDEMYKVNESKMNEIGLGKNRGVNSAVHIASAICSSSMMRILNNFIFESCELWQTLDAVYLHFDPQRCTFDVISNTQLLEPVRTSLDDLTGLSFNKHDKKVLSSPEPE